MSKYTCVDAHDNASVRERMSLCDKIEDPIDVFPRYSHVSLLANAMQQGVN